MRIIHYTLGLPPYRSGGLTKYATDLMLAQHNNGDIVSLIYPGGYTFWQSQKKIIFKNNIFNGVSVYEIKNPSPVPLLYGIRNPKTIIGNGKKKLSEKVLAAFYKKINPDILHIHTWMGLPPELVLYFKKNGVKIIYTSHDYFGLCPKVNFINQNGKLCDIPNGLNCAICNKRAPNTIFLRLRNSKYALKHKKKISSITNIKLESQKKVIAYYPGKNKSEEYKDLYNYYQELFSLVDCFHFNSSVSEEVFKNNFKIEKSSVISITHADIFDSINSKEIDQNQVRLGFIGNTSEYKGFPLLKKVLIELEKKGILNWSLQVWGNGIGSDINCEKISYKGKYTSSELKNVFNSLDLLIVPSICKETFSLITLEALSYGLPVLVSTNVGAKDVVKIYSLDFIIPPTKDAFFLKLKYILEEPMILKNYNEKIKQKLFYFNLETHIQKIEQLYFDVLKK